ncbi:hypothetical protein F5890DRAFT_1562136 [Lentinula detonsa]|uniref:F-box domain-containing protein n=1 Tax=Lentinula detonsa TaxID=2804962 RepID=A0AA38Q9D9_9AGAR|nr:hypothetical protein F5890DRAFT_1562136 [Lentinula detonsa]
MPFSCLPAEIYAAFIEQLNEPDIRPTLLALTRAIPRSPVPRYQLFRRIRIKADQLVQLYQRIRPRQQDIERQEEEPRTWVQELSLETWTADAEIVLNILTLLPNLSALTIWIGPKNFTPEHLEELFSIDREGRCLRCVKNLSYLSLRFRPYVQKASYHQFLSGSYFDSILESLSRWPPGRLSTLSIVQDPLTSESLTSEGSEVSPPSTFSLGLPQLAAGFAQPIVFFQLESTFPSLLRGPYLRIPLQTLRLRFPSRNITRSLTQAPVPHPPSYGASIPAGSKPSSKYVRRVANAHLSPTPYLKFLDLSTCLISESSLPQIITQYPSLTHIILDSCNVLRNHDVAIRDNAREWGSVSMSCAVAGMGKAKERERKLNAWLDAPRTGKKRGGKLDDRGSQAHNSARTRGRKGLATATLSLRKEDTLSESPSFRPAITDSSTPERIRIRILPPLPTLRNLTANLYVPASMITSETSMLPPDILDPLLVDIHREWERGWAEGLTQLVKARERIHASWRNNLVRVMRFATAEELGDFGMSSSENHAQSSLGTGDSSPRSHLTKMDFRLSEANNSEITGDPLQDLIEVVDKSEFDVDMSELSSQVSSTSVGKAPVLCLAGVSLFTNSGQGVSSLAGDIGSVAIQGIDHTLGCAHEVNRKLWLDGM